MTRRVIEMAVMITKTRIGYVNDVTLIHTQARWLSRQQRISTPAPTITHWSRGITIIVAISIVATSH